ncbi:branched-chain amino acid ABC transporter ATP-binding protein/permease [Acidothermaceae bacterium B102]|nr:branched-chain amino acid ABC transporter ATP-binding protein/permease [Acidothermaceae bacterium B102]
MTIPQQPGHRRGRGAAWIGALVVYVVATLMLAHSSNYHQGLLLVAASFAMLALSLDLVAGMTGMYSLGHAGLFAIGAYGTTILQSKEGWSIFAALPVVALAAGLIGLVVGTLSLRVSGLYFAITTLIFTIIVNVLLSNLTITGGYQGLPSPPFPEFPAGLSSLGTALVWAVSACLLVTVAVIWSIRASAFYPVLLAIRDSEPFAATSGVRTNLTRVLIFSLSSALAGLAGWAFAFQGFITPGQFDSTASINILVMVILGGINTRLGPIVGAAFISLFPVIVSIDPLWQEILFGAIFVAVIVFLPEGFIGLLARIGRMARGRWWPASLVTADPGPVPDRLAARHLPAGERPAVALQAQEIRFSYGGGVLALDGVDLTVATGTIHGLIGPNGSGKSTMVNLLSGLLKPQSGSITINGQRAEHLAVWQRADLGVMRTFQSAVMVKELTTRANVGIGLYSRIGRLGTRSLAWPLIPSAHRDAQAMSATSAGALRTVGLSSRWQSSRVADIPHGVEQLTQLAAACVSGPSLLILDEPLAGLSSDEVDEVATVLRTLRDAGVTTIVIEHQTRFIFDVCDNVTVLAAGELVRSGTAAEVRNDPRVREVYLGQ